MTDQRPARVERDGPLATVVIDHPPLNLFGAEMIESISEAIAEVESSDARALILRNAVKSFLTEGPGKATFEGR